ncbi:MAG: hypothetical protein HY023_13860 [Chloroflexi bacterium]|nr:hypothetical protein [Chloroflexota bacterium]
MTITAPLRRLESSGLIRLAQAQPELEYLFRHALVQEAAYHSLVKQDRKYLHLAVGEAIERTHPDRLEELAPLLGHHFYEAGDDARALEYFTLAGDAAARVYANVEAVMHYARALEVARRLPVDNRQLMRLYTRRGRALELNGDYDLALVNYREMEATALECGDRALELAALMARATRRSGPMVARDPARGQALSEKALGLARELGDRAAEAKILWNLMLLHKFLSHLQETVEYGEQSVALARELGLREQLAFTLNDIYLNYVAVGQLERGRAALSEARELWRELGNLPMLTDNLSGTSGLHMMAGEYNQSLAVSEEAHRLSHEIGNQWGQSYSLYWVGLVHAEWGEPDRAIEAMEECIHLGEAAGFVHPMVEVRCELAWVYAGLGEVNHSLELTRAALAKADELLPNWRPMCLATLAAVYLLRGDLAAAEAAMIGAYPDIEKISLLPHAIALIRLADSELALAKREYDRVLTLMDELAAKLRALGMRPFLADAYYQKGRALLTQGRDDEAGEVLQEGRLLAQSLGSRRSLWPILFALSQIEARRGNEAEAQSLRREACEVVEYIAAHTPTPELRESFLSLPEVSHVINAGVTHLRQSRGPLNHEWHE